MPDSAYDTDLSDEQWLYIAPLIPPPKPGGRPRTTDVRRVIDAIFYLCKTGCQWRSLPKDFPHWRTVYEYFMQWRDDGTMRRLHRRSYFDARLVAGRNRYPTAVIIDSQSVRTFKMARKETVGYDGGKRIKGRKRHTIVDTLGLPMTITVTKASTHDLKGGEKSLTRLSKFLRGRMLKTLYADGMYGAQRFRASVTEKFDATVRVAENLAQKFKKFIPVSQRWVVERSFSWWYDYRRLIIDHERLLKSSRAMLHLAAIRLILNRLAPPPNRPRWS